MSVPASSSARRQLKTILVLFFGISAGIFIFMMVSIVLLQMIGPLYQELSAHHTALLAGLTVLSVICLLLGRKIFRNGLESARSNASLLQEKLSIYQSAFVKYLLICELSVTVSIVLFLLTGNFVFQVYAAVLFGLMLVMAPLKKKVIEQLQLSWQEQQELEKTIKKQL